MKIIIGAPALNRIRNPRGNAIILVLPLLIVVAAAVELSLNQTISYTNTVKSYRVVGVRNSLSTLINSYSTMASTFRSSLHPSLTSGVNPDLQNCVFGTGPAPCLANKDLPVTLYAPVSSASATPPAQALQTISGPLTAAGNAQPALYDIHGLPCTTGTTVATLQCPFQVFTSFIATCALNAPSCAVAQSIAVHYQVSVPQSLKLANNLTLKDIDVHAPLISVQSILPPVATAGQNNISVSYNIPVAGSVVTVATSTSTSPSLSAIDSAVAAGGVTDPSDIATIAQAFINAGYLDLSFISAVTSAGYSTWGTSVMTGLIANLAMSGVTNVNTATFLTQVGVTDSTWMNIVIASGISNAYLANAEYTIYSDQGNPQMLGAAVGAATAAGLPNDAITVAIVGTGQTNPTIDKQLYASVSTIPDQSVAAGLIAGGLTSNLAQMTAISNAVAGIYPLTAGAIAQVGVANANVAAQLVNAVSSISNPYLSAQVIVNGGGNVAATAALAAQQIATAATAPSGSGNTVTVTTTTVVMPAPTPTISTSTSQSQGPSMQMISSCLSCAILTF